MVPLSPIPSMVPGDRELGLESVDVTSNDDVPFRRQQILDLLLGSAQISFCGGKCAQEAIPQEPEEE